MRKTFEQLLKEQAAARDAAGTDARDPAPGGPSDTEQALPAISAREDAARLSLLTADARQAITDYKAPETILHLLTVAIFGEAAGEVAAVDAIIADSQAPGGYEMTMAALEDERRTLRNITKALELKARDIAAALERTDAAIARTKSEHAQQTERQAAMVSILGAFEDMARPDLDRLRGLYEQYRGIPAAMGLLYGLTTEAAQAGYAGNDYGLAMDNTFETLRRDILEAAAGRPFQNRA